MANYSKTSSVKTEIFQTLFRIGSMYAIGVGVVLVTFPVWTVELGNVIKPFLVVPAIVVVPFALLGSVVFALGVLGLGIWQRSILAPVPFLLNGLAIAAFWFIPFDELFYRAEFELLYDDRKTIVEDIEAEERLPNVEHTDSLIHIEGRGRLLSRGGGDVMFGQRDGETDVFFFTYRGILDNYEGFMYRSDDIEPTRCFRGEIALAMVKMRDHWYWMSCT